MTATPADKLKEIKQSFRLLMNGAAAKSMRDMGLEYHLNWGVSLPDLKNMAQRYGKDYSLAAALWKEEIRECKVLATMIMPHGQMTADLAEIWLEQTRSPEIAEQAVANLYRFSPDASLLAYRWIAGEGAIRQMSGFHLFSWLFREGATPNGRDADEYIDQALSALRDPSAGVRRAALNSLNYFASLGEEQQKIVDITLEKF